MGESSPCAGHLFASLDPSGPARSQVETVPTSRSSFIGRRFFVFLPVFSRLGEPQRTLYSRSHLRKRVFGRGKSGDSCFLGQPAAEGPQGGYLMTRWPFTAITLLICALGACPAWLRGEAMSSASDVGYPGTCDASTAIAIDSDRFVTASDEDNALRIYRRDVPEAPVIQDITELLALPNPKKEADIEGSALLRDTLFFITSHGRNKDGEIKLNRYRFFGLRLANTSDTAHFEKVGKPYTRLLEDMLEEQSLKTFALDPLKPEADAARAPEKEGSTNIEGLCAWRENQLLIAFRNPVPGGKALLVPLLNPRQIIEGEKARFGEP